LSDAVQVIKSEILRRSQEEAERIISETEEKARHIVSAAEMTADEVLAKSIKPEISVMRKRILGSARLEGRKLLLQAKSEVVSRVFELVKERLSRIAEGKDPGYNYEELLFQLLSEAAQKFEEKRLMVTSNEQTLSYLRKNLRGIEERVRDALESEISLEVENSPYNCVGGVVVSNPNRTKVFYNCLEGRLLRLREILTGKVGEILFS